MRMAGNLNYILVVDDEKSVRDVIKNFCSSLHDRVFGMGLGILFIAGLSVTTIIYCIDQNKFESLEKKVELSKYQEVSLYSAFGSKSGTVNGVRMVPTPIDDWNKDYAYYYDNLKVNFKCEPGAKEACLGVIKKMPLYPFSYYFLAKCLKEENNSTWVEMAQKAKEILEKTTQIPGHKRSHDSVLRELTNLFN